MELTWLADTPQSRRRTRALRACAYCQRRKKRCRHLGLESNPGHARAETVHSPINSSSPGTRQAAQSAPNPTSPAIPRTERFVGDLNPEAMIREKLDVTTENQLRDRIGLWISSPAAQNKDDRPCYPNADTVAPDCMGQTPESQTVASILNQRYASAMKTQERLPSSTRDLLISIYLSKVNHILPLVDKDSFILAQSEGTVSVFLERAICLVAAKDRSAASCLRLLTNGPLVSSRQFCSELYKGLVVVTNEGLEPDRITRIRVLALMSLHCEGYEGAEAASMHLCQAIHQAQTVGLHLSRPGRAPGDSLSDLFWCLWTLDKMHASIGGRPVLLADRDIGIEKPGIKAPNSRTAFDVWLAISDLLSNVISYYRPNADHTVGWEADFPAFEEIIGDNFREDLDFVTLGFLELFHHAVGILSCRHKLSDRPDGSKPSYVRQGLAAIRIHSIIATECSQSLPPLPIVPYALALAMGVSYQQFRSSKLITHFDRAKASLGAACTLLEELGAYWYSAEAMARLGRKALHQIQEVRPECPRHVQDSRGRTVSENMSMAPPQSNIATSALSFVLPENDRRSFNNVSPVAPIQEPSALETLESPSSGLESGGLADIDMLFGDFLDLSLPTNFWDHIFFSEDHTGT